MSSFNPTQAVNSESYRFNAYINYMYLGNTLCMTPEEFEAFEALYGSSFKDWDAKFESTDISEYVIPDEDLNASLDEGIAYTEEQTGFDEKDEDTAGWVAGASGAGVLLSAGGGVAAYMGTASSKIAEAIAKATESAVSKEAGKAASMPFIIGAALVAAQGALNVVTATTTNRQAAMALVKIAELMEGEGMTALQNSINSLDTLVNDTNAKTELAAINAEEHGANADMITKAFLEGESAVNALLAEKADLEVQMQEKQELVLQKEAELETLQADPEKNAERIAVLQGEIGALNGEIAKLVEDLATNGENIKLFNDIFAILNEEYKTSKEENQTENEAINEEIAAGAEKYNNERANIEFQKGKIKEEADLHGNALARSITNLVASIANMVSGAIVMAKAIVNALWGGLAAAITAGVGIAASATANGFEADNIKKIGDVRDVADDFQGEIDGAVGHYENSLTHYVANEEMSISYEDVIAASEYEGEGAQAEG